MTKETTQSGGFFGRIATVFLYHRELGVLTIIGIVLAGVLSFALMPKQYNPEITAPAFRIVTPLPGATAEEVLQLVTKRVEDRVREIPTVDKVMAQSLDGGASIVVAQFFIGENVEDAKITLTQKMQDMQRALPHGAGTPQVTAIDPDDVPIVTVALSSRDLSLRSVRAVAWDTADALKRVANVARVDVVGAERTVVRVALDPAKLAHYGIAPQMVADVIRGNNLLMPVGAIKSPLRYDIVRVDGAPRTPEEIGALIVAMPNGVPVRVRDLATVTEAPRETIAHARFARADAVRDAVFVAVAKRKGSNATTVSDDVRAALADLRTRGVIPPEVDATVVRDNGKVAREATTTLTVNLFSSIGIVAAVLLLFLGWRSAAIVLLSIPLTLAVVFSVGNLAGQTINRITLFALILSLGILVDAAIVVVENIFRLLKENALEHKYTVIARAVAEVGPGLVMSTMTVILAFIPMAFVTGMMGPYMGPIPFFVPAALLASLALALTVNPFLTDLFTRHYGRISEQCDGITPTQPRENVFLRTVGKLRGAYGAFLSHVLASSALRRGIIGGVVVLLLIALALPATKIVPFRMLPKADTEQFSVYIDLPTTASLERTDAVARKVTDFLLAQPHIVSVQSYVGMPSIVDFNGLFKGSDARRNPHQATLKVNLTHHTTRNTTSEEIVLALRPKLKSLLADDPDVHTQLIEDPPGPPVLATYLLKVQSANDTVRDMLTKELAQFARSTRGVVDVDTSVPERAPEEVLRVDREAVSRAGLSVYDVAMTLRTLLSGTEVALFHAQDASRVRQSEEELIVLTTDRAARDDVGDLAQIQLRNRMGQMVPLLSVVERVPASAVPLILTDERARTQYVFAEMGDRSVIYAMIDTLAHLVREVRPFGDDTRVAHWNLFGVTYEHARTHERVTVLLDGEWKLTLEVFRDLGLAMGVALVMIYFVLVARFRSLAVPALIMGTIPFALIGVLPGFALLFALSGVYFNATSMIGVIALSGIVVNNAIMFLEYLQILRARGYAIEEAIIKTGKTRLLPILLTSLTTILGSLTIVSDPVWEGLAWSIIWGLSLAAFLTLVIFPILYYRFQRDAWRADAKQSV